MTNVLEFPSREKQAYQFLTEQLSTLLRDKGADQELIDHATQLLSKVYGELEHADFSFSVDLPSDIAIDEAERLQQQIGSGIEALGKHHHSLTLKLAASLRLVLRLRGELFEGNMVRRGFPGRRLRRSRSS